MNDRRSTRLLRSVASLMVTLALLVGVPLLLVTAVGWPLPTSIPTIEALTDGARTGISDQVIVNTLAVIAWFAWSQLALAFLVETIAIARGRHPVRLPVLPGFQVTAARLLAGMLTITSTFQPMRVAAAEPLTPIVIEATAAPAPSQAMGRYEMPTGLVDHASASPTVEAADELPTVTVQRHDSYWAIAERTLGDGFRWREIHDLNVGRTLPDGTTIATGDDTLHTGWVLLLPADANGDHATLDQTPRDDEMAGEPVAGTVVVERDDNLWTIAQERLESDLGREATDAEVAPYWQQVVTTNQDRYIEPGNPSLILPGQVLDLPSTGHEPPPVSGEGERSPEPEVVPQPVEPPAPDEPAEPNEPASEPATTTPTTSPPVATSAPESTAVADDEAANDSEPTDIVPIAIAVGGLSSIALAVGLKRLIDRRRRRFVDEHDGQLPGRTPPDQRETHQAIVAQADEERIDDLQGALGHLAAALAAGSSARRPRMVRHAADSLEVLLDEPDAVAPPGWASSEDGEVWTLAEAPDPDDLYDGPLSPAPLMVTIGQPEDDAQLYLDLEADGLTALTGDPSVAMDLARSILTELTLSPLAETLRVIGVGAVVDEDAEALEHLTIVDSWDGIAEDISAWASQSHAAIVDQGWPNAFIGRGHDPDHDALVPVAIVADRPPPQELAEVLLANRPSTVAVVVLGDFEGAVASLRCEPDTLNFDMIDLACTPQALDGDELADMARIVVAADSPEEQLVMEELLAEYQALGTSNGSTPGGEPNGQDQQHDQHEPPSAEVLVRLLGDITVEADRPLKPKATAVVAYLALHRSVATERLEEACWFGSDGVSHIKRLHDTMTEARAAIGSQHLPANRNGTYVAGPQLRTDLEIFDWHVNRAANLEPAVAVEHYRAALDLVAGKPFTYTGAARRSYGWVDFEHHATTWEQRVAGIAQACAAMYLDLGEQNEAIEMLRRIVQAIPLNSAVVETLMRAHLAADDPAGAEGVYREHVAALNQAKLGEPAEAIEQVRLDSQGR